MCLMALALDQRSRFPFVLASNRDEFYARPTASLDWWTPEANAPMILGGRDLSEGGTWLGLTPEGRLGLVTNVRDPQRVDPKAPSRGHIVTQWLKGDMPMSHLWPRLAMIGYNGFNMIALDFADGDCFWLNNTRVYPERLHKGIFALSNAALNTPWPKTKALKLRMKEAIASASDAETLSQSLFSALADRTQAPDDQLPSTGVSLEWERVLSSAFIHAPELGYGTRVSTVIVTERVHKRLITHVMERTFNPVDQSASMRQVSLKNWPPRHSMPQTNNEVGGSAQPNHPSRNEHFESSGVSEQMDHSLAEAANERKTRARNLIKKAPSSLKGE